MDKEPIQSVYPVLSEAISDGLERTRKENEVIIEYAYEDKRFLLYLTPEIRGILFFEEERNHLQDLILRGFRITEENGFENYGEESIMTGLFSEYGEGKTFAEKTQNLYGGEETITENIQELIEKMKTSHYSSSKLCLGYWLTVLLPDNLDLEKGENDIYTDSEFIAELVVNGFRVEEVSDN